MTNPTPAGEPNVIERNAKAIIGVLAALGTAIGLVIADPNTSALLPESWVQRIVIVAGALVTLGGVFGIRNSRTVEQAQADLDRAIERKAKRSPRRRARKRTTTPRRPRLRHPSAPDPAAATAEPQVLADDADDDPGRHRAPEGGA